MSPPLEIVAGSLSLTKSEGRTAILYANKSWLVVAAATVTAHPRSALLVTQMPAVGMDWPLFDLHLAKPSYDDDNYLKVYTRIIQWIKIFSRNAK